MKKFILIVCMCFMLPVFADNMPFYVDTIPKDAIGMFQIGDNITIYSHPEANSKVVKKMDFSYNPETMPDNTFALLINEKKLGFLYVSDITLHPQICHIKYVGSNKIHIKTYDGYDFFISIK